MLSKADHADTMLSMIRNYVKTSPTETTRDTVIQFLCQDGQVVTTDRSLLLCYSPFLRSVICSVPSSSLVISLPDASSSGLEAVLNMVGQAWVEDVYVLTEEQLGVVRTLGIPCGGVEKVQIVDFGPNILQAGIDYFPSNTVSESSKAMQDDRGSSDSSSSSIKCTQCEMDFGELSEDSKDEIAIHIGEIHSELELLAEYYKIFPGGSNTCGLCDYKVRGEYVQKEHILLHHPWPLLRSMVEELCGPARDGASVGILVNNDGNDHKVKETNQKDVIKVNKAAEETPIPEEQLPTKDGHGHVNANIKPADVDNNKAKKSKRGRKRKCDLETTESPKSPLVFPYVPQRKSAKKASLYITKALEGEKRYKQQDIGMFVRKVEKNREDKEESELSNSNLNNTCELMDDIEKLLKDSDDDDDEEETLGLEISYANSEIEGIQDYIEFSDSDSEEIEKNNDVLNYSIKVENKSLTENDKTDKDLLEIQNGIMYSDSEEED